MSRWLITAEQDLRTLPAGMIPQLISDKPKLASSAAIARSQATSELKPAPKHQPLTIAMVGLMNDMRRAVCHRLARKNGARASMLKASVARKNSRRSIPAQ